MAHRAVVVTAQPECSSANRNRPQAPQEANLHITQSTDGERNLEDSAYVVSCSETLDEGRFSVTNLQLMATHANGYS